MRNFFRVLDSGVNLKAVTIVIISLLSFCLSANAWAGSSSDVLGEVKLKPAGKIEKTAGIWVDGQYLGVSQGTQRDQKRSCCCRVDTKLPRD